MEQSPRDAEKLRLAAAGDMSALFKLFEQYRPRLQAMVRLRLNQRLQGRLDPSDVVQDAYLEASRVLQEYLRNPSMPFYLWLRHITGQQLIVAHRRHLGASMRNASREVSLYRRALPEASSASIAAQLLGRFSSPSQASIRAELQIRLQEALNSMNPLDREVLVLRHFEQLSNGEVAQLLGIDKSAASKRHVRALDRLQTLLGELSAY